MGGGRGEGRFAGAPTAVRAEGAGDDGAGARVGSRGVRPPPDQGPEAEGILSDALRERVGQRPRQRSVREGGRVSGRRGAGRWWR